MTSKLRAHCTGTCTSARSGSHQEYRCDHIAMDIHARFVPNRPLASMDRREERVYPVHDHFEDAYSADGLTPTAYASTLQFGVVGTRLSPSWETPETVSLLFRSAVI